VLPEERRTLTVDCGDLEFAHIVVQPSNVLSQLRNLLKTARLQKAACKRTSATGAGKLPKRISVSSTTKHQAVAKATGFPCSIANHKLPIQEIEQVCY
jgi:hypothetical protein